MVLDDKDNAAAALVRVSKGVGGWATDKHQFNFVDSNVATTAIGAGLGFSVPLLLNGLQLGTGGSNRIGRSILMKTIYIWAAQAGTQSRHIILYDKQANGAAPAIADVFQVTTTARSPLNYSYLDRFALIYDQWLPLVGDTYTVDNFDIELETYFNSGNAGTVADISSGALYYMLGGVPGGVSTPYIRIEYEEE